MKYNTIYVGLDVHKETSSVSIAPENSKEVEYLYKIESTTKALDKLIGKLKKRSPILHFCYEAGPCGFNFYRHLVKRGFKCDVVAPSLVPRKPGEKIKTDRLDSERLAKFLRAGELTAIWVPDESDEAIRDLCRARDDAKDAQKRAKQHLLSFLNRHSQKYPGKTPWTKTHYAWLGTLNFKYRADNLVLQEYLEWVECTGRKVNTMEKEMLKEFETWHMRPVAQALMALRGFDWLGAMGLLTEVGDLRRFKEAKHLMAYSGSVPRESSSGNRIRRGPITGVGNAKVRRLLIEAAWTYRHPARRTAHWKAKAAKSPEEAQAISWKAMKRLHSRYWRILNKTGYSKKAVVSIARELAGFVWAIGQIVEPEPLKS